MPAEDVIESPELLELLQHISAECCGKDPVEPQEQLQGSNYPCCLESEVEGWEEHWLLSKQRQELLLWGSEVEWNSLELLLASEPSNLDSSRGVANLPEAPSSLAWQEE